MTDAADSTAATIDATAPGPADGPGPHAGVTPLLREIRSRRTFVDEDVSDDDLHLLLEAARWAPSTWNTQPWRFVIVHRGDRAIFDAVVASLSDSNQRWARSAPLLIVVAASPVLDDGTPNRHALHDAGIATAFMTVQAAARGLHVQSMAGFRPDAARAAVGVPAAYEVVTVLAVGRSAASDTAPPQDLDAGKPRRRKPLAEIARSGTWDHPYVPLTPPEP